MWREILAIRRGKKLSSRKWCVEGRETWFKKTDRRFWCCIMTLDLYAEDINPSVFFQTRHLSPKSLIGTVLKMWEPSFSFVVPLSMTTLASAASPAYQQWPIQLFKSSPLQPPIMNVTKNGKTEPGYLFLSPTDVLKLHGFLAIYTDDGPAHLARPTGKNYWISISDTERRVPPNLLERHCQYVGFWVWINLLLESRVPGNPSSHTVR